MMEILLVEDNPGDVRLTQEALGGQEGSCLRVVENGMEALAFLRREGAYVDAVRPDLILLDLNMPGKSGREVLAEIKRDRDLRRIPVVVLTVSRDEEDVTEAYALQANCFVTKPLDLDQFLAVIQGIERFWAETAKLPVQ